MFSVLLYEHSFFNAITMPNKSRVSFLNHIFLERKLFVCTSKLILAFSICTFCIVGFCRPLKPINVDLSCSRNGRPVDCDSPVRPNTVVRPRCKPFYKVEQVSYRDLSCQEDGEWTNPLFSCVPGKKHKIRNTY